MIYMIYAIYDDLYYLYDLDRDLPGVRNNGANTPLKSKNPCMNPLLILECVHVGRAGGSSCEGDESITKKECQDN